MVKFRLRYAIELNLRSAIILFEALAAFLDVTAFDFFLVVFIAAFFFRCCMRIIVVKCVFMVSYLSFVHVHLMHGISLVIVYLVNRTVDWYLVEVWTT